MYPLPSTCLTLCIVLIAQTTATAISPRTSVTTNRYAGHISVDATVFYVSLRDEGVVGFKYNGYNDGTRDTEELFTISEYAAMTVVASDMLYVLNTRQNHISVYNTSTVATLNGKTPPLLKTHPLISTGCTNMALSAPNMLLLTCVHGLYLYTTDPPTLVDVNDPAQILCSDPTTQVVFLVRQVAGMWNVEQYEKVTSGSGFLRGKGVRAANYTTEVTSCTIDGGYVYVGGDKTLLRYTLVDMKVDVDFSAGCGAVSPAPETAAPKASSKAKSPAKDTPAPLVDVCVDYSVAGVAVAAGGVLGVLDSTDRMLFYDTKTLPIGVSNSIVSQDGLFVFMTSFGPYFLTSDVYSVGIYGAGAVAATPVPTTPKFANEQQNVFSVKGVISLSEVAGEQSSGQFAFYEASEGLKRVVYTKETQKFVEVFSEGSVAGVVLSVDEPEMLRTVLWAQNAVPDATTLQVLSDEALLENRTLALRDAVHITSCTAKQLLYHNGQVFVLCTSNEVVFVDVGATPTETRRVRTTGLFCLDKAAQRLYISIKLEGSPPFASAFFSVTGISLATTPLANQTAQVSQNPILSCVVTPTGNLLIGGMYGALSAFNRDLVKLDDGTCCKGMQGIDQLALAGETLVMHDSYFAMGGVDIGAETTFKGLTLAGVVDRKGEIYDMQAVPGYVFLGGSEGVVAYKTIVPPTTTTPATTDATASPTTLPTGSPSQPDTVAPLSEPSPTPDVVWCEFDSTCRVHGDVHAICVRQIANLDNSCACYNSSFVTPPGTSICKPADVPKVGTTLQLSIQLNETCAPSSVFLHDLEVALGGRIRTTYEIENPTRIVVVMTDVDPSKIATADLNRAVPNECKVIHTTVFVSSTCDLEGATMAMVSSTGHCEAFACETSYSLTAGACVAEAGSSSDSSPTLSIVSISLGVVSLVLCCCVVYHRRTATGTASCPPDEEELKEHTLLDHIGEDPRATPNRGNNSFVEDLATPPPLRANSQLSGMEMGRLGTGVRASPLASAVSNTLQSHSTVNGSVYHAEDGIFKTEYQSQTRKSCTPSIAFEEMSRTDFDMIQTLQGVSEHTHGRRIGPFHEMGLVTWKSCELLGRGSYGYVYLGSMKGDKRKFAMKSHWRKSEEEAQEAAAQIEIFRKMGQHKNVVSMLDVIYVCETHTMCVFMEYVDGPTLATLAQAGMDEMEAARIMRHVVAGLKYLHSHDMVHRDVKGENVLLSADRSVAKLCDFGFLKMLGGAPDVRSVIQTEGNTLAGTPGWMAPEVVDNGPVFVKSGKPADIYSVGCTLSEVLNKGVPPGPEVMNVWAWVAKEGKKPEMPENIATGISPEATNFIQRCLCPDPQDRPTAEALEVHPFFGSVDFDSFPCSSLGSTKILSCLHWPALSEQEMETWMQTDILGQGSFGTVYLGQLPDARQVAVKTIAIKGKKTDDLLRCAQAEFRLLASLQHPNIVRCLGHRWDGQQLEIFMELVTGGSVRNLVKRMKGGRLMDSVVCVYTKQVLEALQYLHGGANGRPAIAHRDIKGDNLLIDREGTIKLADFGCSKLFEGVGQGAETFVGTPNWMAPEVLSTRIGQSGVQQYGTRCDIWSLGCTIIEMMGRTPWRERSGETSYDIMHRIASSEGGPPVPANPARGMDEFLTACFQRDPAKRATAAELLRYSYIRLNCITTSGSPQILAQDPPKSYDTVEEAIVCS